MNTPLNLLFCILAGALIAPALAPFELYFLALLPPALLYLLSRSETPRRNLLQGWCFGLGFFGSGVSWVFVSIYEHSQTPLALALLMTALFVMLLATLFSLQLYLWKRFFAQHYIWLSFAGIWLLFEWLRSWLFTGFPWLYLGYASLDTPLQNWLPIGGVWLASTVIIYISLAATEGFRSGKKLLTASAVLPIMIALILPAEWTQPAGDGMQVTIVQADIAQSEKWDPAHRQEILDTYTSLSEPHLETDLLLWPETAIPAFLQQAALPLADFLDQLDRNGSTLISGLPTAEPDPNHAKGYRIHNSLAVLSSGSGIYHKQRLVPFGEYLPLETVLRGVLDFFNLPMSSFSLPIATQENLRVKGNRLATAICYEIAYPELVRLSAKESEYLLTVSNDTWFGRSIAPAQHMQIARARALENGRWLIRSTNNGITALVSPQGEITKRLPQYQQGVLTGEVIPMQGLTPYQKSGVFPALAIMLLLTSLGAVRLRHSVAARAATDA